MALRIIDITRKNKWLWALIACAALSACVPKGPDAQVPEGESGTAHPAASNDTSFGATDQSVVAEASTDEAQSAPSPASGYDFDGGGAQAPSEDFEPAPASAPRARAEAKPDTGSSRPGLGTVWGEDRTSQIQNTSFFRAEPERPFALATLFYNDRAGIKAMARESALSNHGDGGFDVLGGAVSVRLLDAMGRPLPAFEVASRDYVLGENGQSYSIEVQNHTGERIEAVATVDGLDVVDGEPGSFMKRGYVVGPFDTLQIDGFRRSMDTVAAFRFGSVRNSYAATKGKARNVGVIGVAFFHERGSDLPWSSQEVRRRHTADPFPDRFAAPPRR